METAPPGRRDLGARAPDTGPQVATVDALARFIPMDRRHALAVGAELPAQASGAVLFADLAGYTALSAALSAGDPAQAGAAIQRALAPFFATLLHQIHAYGGSAVGFAGDAVTAWFRADDGRRALAAAAAVQAALPTLPPVILPDGAPQTLAVKIVVTVGTTRRFLVGDPAHGLCDVLAGPPLARAGIGEHLAHPGEILLDETAAALSGAGGEWRTAPDEALRFLALTATLPLVDPAPWPPLPATALSAEQALAWVPAAARPRLLADPTFLPELRPAVPLFLRFRGLDYTRPMVPTRLDAYIRWVQGVLAHYGGTLLDLVVGDKGNYLCAAFGAPVAYSDAATRAAAAALDLLTPPPACPYIAGVQIGLASGEVYAGPYGSAESATYGALGPMVNQAARLMQAAGPGSILATRAVRQAAGPRFAWTALPPLAVKGEAAPVAVYGLLGPAHQRPAGGADGPLVGRRAELAVLGAVLARAATGHGQVVGVTGEAGLGKSRIVAEVAQGAAAAGWAVYSSAAPSYGIDTPYLAWQRIWQMFFDLDPTEPPAAQALDLEDRLAELALALRPRLPLLGSVLGLPLPDTPLTAGLEPSQRQSALLALLADCLRARAANTPVLLVLEDCHWLDPLSHDLLEAVARALVALPMVVLLTYRPPELARLQAGRVEALPHFTALPLAGLPVADAAALVTARLADGPGAAPPGEWIAELVARAGGNPFYLEELVAYAREQGIDLADPVARARLAWPSSLQSLLLARIDQLTEPQRQVLKVASIIGARFPVAYLWGVHPTLGPAERVGADLAALATADLILPEAAAPEPTHRFKHTMTHEVTYGTLPAAVRASLHEHFAAWLEAGADVPLDLLVYHYAQSANDSKACDYLRLAADTALAAGAFAAAEADLSAVLARLGEHDPQRAAVLVARGDAREALGAFAAAEADYMAAREMAGAGISVRMDAARGLGVVYQKQSAYTEAIAWLTTAQQEYRAAGADAGAARALAELGVAYWGLGAYAQAGAVLEDAIAQATLAGTPRVRALALRNLGNVVWRQGDLARARVLYEASLDLRHTLGDRAGIAQSLNNLGIVAQEQGALAHARSLYEESLALCRELGDRLGAANALSNLGNVALDRGDLVSAGALLEESLTLFWELGSRIGIIFTLNNRGELAHAQGDLAGARTLYEESLALAQEVGARVGLTLGYNSLGLVALDQGDLPAARAAISASLALVGGLGPGQRTQNALALAAVLVAPPLAAELLGALAALIAAQGAQLKPLIRQAAARAASAARLALGPAAYEQAFATGQTLDWEAAIARAALATQ